METFWEREAAESRLRWRDCYQPCSREELLREIRDPGPRFAWANMDLPVVVVQPPLEVVDDRRTFGPQPPPYMGRHRKGGYARATNDGPSDYEGRRTLADDPDLTLPVAEPPVDSGSNAQVRPLVGEYEPRHRKPTPWTDFMDSLMRPKR